MKHEIVEMNDVQIIGMSKEIAFCHPEECTSIKARTRTHPTTNAAS